MNFLNFFKAGFIWCGILLSLQCYGQSVSFKIPLGAMPMQFNSSFAGETGAPRLSSIFIFANAGDGIDPHYERIYGINTSFDTYVPSLRSGIGVTAGYEGVNSSLYDGGNTNFISVSVAPKFSFRGKYTLSPSVDISHYTQKFTEKQFPDNTFEKAELREFLRSRMGLLLNTQKFYIGYSINLTGNIIPNRFISWAQVGYTFQKTPDAKFSFTPQIVFPITDQFFKLLGGEEYVSLSAPLFNFNFRYSKFIWGINNAGFHIGLQQEKLRLVAGSNLGITLENDIMDKYFTGNLSFRYIFNKADKGLDQSRF